MKNFSFLIQNRALVQYGLYDIFIILVFYYIPTISHLLRFPLYQLEPMRIMVIFSLIYTSRLNTFIIAISLPIFSFLISTHPNIYKVILITSELLLNVHLFYWLNNNVRNNFIVAFISILLSKIFYYFFKYIFLGFEILEGDLISTPIELQLMICLIFAIVVHFFWKKND